LPDFKTVFNINIIYRGKPNNLFVGNDIDFYLCYSMLRVVISYLILKNRVPYFLEASIISNAPFPVGFIDRILDI